MFANWKEKLNAKKAKDKAIAESRRWRENPLLQVCLQAMRGSCTLAPVELHEAAIAAVNIALRENTWSRVRQVPEDFLADMVYIVWDEATMPVLKAPWNLVEENLQAVKAVASETFLVAVTMERIIRFDGHGGIMLYSIA